LLGKTFQDVTLPEDRPVGAELTGRVLSGEMEMFHFEKRYLHKNGTVVWGLVSSTLIRDAQNKPIHFVMQIRDIAERKQAEEALRESESQYRELFESSSDVLS
jgi:PAS domain S-box-containing protein